MAQAEEQVAQRVLTQVQRASGVGMQSVQQRIFIAHSFVSRCVLRGCFLGAAFLLGALPIALSPIALSPIAAQEKPSTDIPPLPAAESDAPLYITGKNVAIYHELLIAPVASWLKEGKFVLRAARDLAQPWKLSDEWMQQSRANAERSSLDDANNLVFPGDKAPPFGLPFGDASFINRERDPQKRAYRVLWNSFAAQLPARDVFYGFAMTTLTPQGPARKIGGVFFRELSAEAPAQRQSESASQTESQPPKQAVERGEIFRELLQLVSPPVVYGLSNITWRPRVGEEDLVWVYSPVIERGRKVFSSNRGDPILEGFFSLDDLFVFSNKIQSVQAKVVDEKVFLVPFAAARPLLLQPERVSKVDPAVVSSSGSDPALPAPEGEAPKEGVLTVRGAVSQQQTSAPLTTPSLSPAASSATPMVSWNYETTLYANSAAWIPTSVTFVPRKVWVIEFSSRDPYYAMGRQILFVDQETMLPVYKIVYDMQGVYAKTVLGGWALAETEDQRVSLPVLGFLLEVERGSRTATSFTTHYARTFEGKPSPTADTLRKLFEISAHGRKRAADQEGASAKGEEPKSAEKGSAEKSREGETEKVDEDGADAPHD